jgi:glycosyltransferase involved in cell wall biosynthesis
MRVLFATGLPAMPEMLGGSQRTSDAVIRGLGARGHEVVLTAGLKGLGWTGFRARVLLKLGRARIAADRRLGYTVFRSWFPWDTIEEVVQRVRPDVVAVLAHRTGLLAAKAEAMGIPVVLVLQDIEVKDHGHDLGLLSPAAAVANSSFTADRYRAMFGIDAEVIHPVVAPERYRTQTSREAVTFVNPHSHKGLDIALAVARALPDVTFDFVESWPLAPSEKKELRHALATLPNVMLRGPTDDMRSVYARSRIALVPSRWEEAYGRVATEAQLSGIPVVASALGGLVEAVGPGGILLDPDGPAEVWVDAVRRLWIDDVLYARLSAAALSHAARPAMQIDHQLDAWERILDAAAHGSYARRNHDVAEQGRTGH